MHSNSTVTAIYESQFTTNAGNTESRNIPPLPADPQNKACKQWHLGRSLVSELFSFLQIIMGGGVMFSYSMYYWLRTPVGESKLSTNNVGIRISFPCVVTHCPPLVVIAHFHSSLQLIGSTHQTSVSSCAVSEICHCIWTKGYRYTWTCMGC